MQGSIFTAFSDMVIEKMGMAEWNHAIEATQPKSQGAYTSSSSYEDDELIKFVVHLSDKTGISVNELVRSFGHYLFEKLYQASPTDLANIKRLRDFLLAVHTTVHHEVKRLHPHAYLPTFEYQENKPGELIMYYQSKRKLCQACVGLIEGAAEKFHEHIEIDHVECMHQGADRCKFVIRFITQ